MEMGFTIILNLYGDNDGCPDALEAPGSFGYYDLDANDQLVGGVGGKGIPTVVSPLGQSTRASVSNGSIRSFCPNTVITNRKITYGINRNWHRIVLGFLNPYTSQPL